VLFTLAFQSATQSTSSEDYPKGSVLARLYEEYLWLILYTNSAPNSPAVIYPGYQPPNPHTLGSTTQIWIKGLLYVDDLALILTYPRELQALLHVCQQWSIRNRMHLIDVAFITSEEIV